MDPHWPLMIIPSLIPLKKNSSKEKGKRKIKMVQTKKVITRGMALRGERAAVIAEVAAAAPPGLRTSWRRRGAGREPSWL